MTTSAPPEPTWRERSQPLAGFVSAVLALTAVVLAILVWTTLADGAAESLDRGETFPLRAEPYGRELVVLLPGGEVRLRVGAPVERIGYDLLDVEYDDPTFDDRGDLGAADDGRLVPLTWQARLGGSYVPEGDSQTVEIHLVAGDERFQLGAATITSEPSYDANEPHPVALAVGEDVGLDDLSVEVSFAGVTQVADVGSGEIDAGVAQALYDDSRYLTSGCADIDVSCELTAGADSPWRPVSATFTVGDVVLYPYDARLGWADEGRLWAGVRVQLFGVNGVANKAGSTLPVRRQSAPVLTLDGAEPVQREGLEAGAFDTYGRVVFEVDEGTDPGELTLEQVLSLRSAPRAPDRLPVSANVDLTPRA